MKQGQRAELRYVNNGKKASRHFLLIWRSKMTGLLIIPLIFGLLAVLYYIDQILGEAK